MSSQEHIQTVIQIQLSEAGFETSIRNIIRSEFANMLNKREEADNEGDIALSTTEVVSQIKVSRQCLYNWRKAGKISFTRIGRRVYFSKADVLAQIKFQPKSASRPNLKYDKNGKKIISI